MFTGNLYLDAFVIILLLQVAFFAIAATFKTDKVTDLSYGLTFVAVALYFAIRNPSPVLLLATMLILLWGLRISGYLFVRILKMGKDDRFDGKREKPLEFAKFWILQAISIWIIMLPYLVLTKIQGDAIFFSQHLALSLALVGLTIETIADVQKWQFKNNPKNKGKWIASGLWKYARHPNYFGEITVWTGLFLYVTPFLSGWAWLTIISPLYIFTLLRYVTGVPPLEKRYDERYKGNKDYEEHKRKTRLFAPIPKSF